MSELDDMNDSREDVGEFAIAGPRYTPPFREMKGYTKRLTQSLRVPIRENASFKALSGGAYFNRFED